MGNELYRKTALENISGPEDLREYMKVTNPGVWLTLLGFAALLSAVLIWLFFGTILYVSQSNGIAYAGQGEPEVYIFLPLSDSQRLQVGMEARISPDYAPREEYGYITGRILEIGSEPMDETGLIEWFGSLSYVDELLPQGNFVPVKIELMKDGSRYLWSNPKGAEVELLNGAYCLVQIIISDRRPYQLLWTNPG